MNSNKGTHELADGTCVVMSRLRTLASQIARIEDPWEQVLATVRNYALAGMEVEYHKIGQLTPLEQLCPTLHESIDYAVFDRRENELLLVGVDPSVQSVKLPMGLFISTIAEAELLWGTDSYPTPADLQGVEL